MFIIIWAFVLKTSWLILDSVSLQGTRIMPTCETHMHNAGIVLTDVTGGQFLYRGFNMTVALKRSLIY